MTTFSEDPETFIAELEKYLEEDPGQGPRDDNSYRLKQVTARLHSAGALAENIAQLLGTAVGKQHKWQRGFRELGILDHAVHNLDLSQNAPSVVKQYLRVIGNSVADNDTNRAIVQEHLPKIIDCLQEEDLRFTAMVVMFNLLTEFEPAHIEAVKLRLDFTLSEYLAAGNVPDEAIQYAVDLLTWTTEQLPLDQFVDSSSIAVFNNVLKLSSQHDDDYFEEYLAVLVHYLQEPKFQQSLPMPATFERLVDLMFAFEDRLTDEELQGVFEELKTQTDANKITSEELGVVPMVRLINSISAMSASDAFVQNYSLQSPLIDMILSRLFPDTLPSTVCSCVILGNLATSDKVCMEMVNDKLLHIPLIRILSSETHQAILYAAAGFTRHLAFPIVNRSTLGEAGLIEACCKLLTHSDPSVRGEAGAILCKLVSDALANIDIVVSREISDDLSLAEVPGISKLEHPTILYHIVTQALAPSAPLPSTTMKNPMIELGRTIIAILRHLRQSASAGDGAVEKYTDEIFKTPAVARPLAALVRQRFYADARAEGLLGLGLMAQTKEGAACVVEELVLDLRLLDAIKEIATGSRDEGKNNNATAGRDYQNAVVLLHGLANNGASISSETTPAWKSKVEKLQAELNGLMAQ